MAEKEQISSGRQELNKIKNNIESRKIDGLTTEEKETTKKELLQLKSDVEKTNPADAGEIYADIIETWNKVKQEPIKDEKKVEKTATEKTLEKIEELKTVKEKFEALSTLSEKDLTELVKTEAGMKIVKSIDENGMNYLVYSIRTGKIPHIMVMTDVIKLENKDIQSMIRFKDKVDNDPETKQSFFNSTNPNSTTKTREYVANMLLTKITSAMVTRAEFIYKHGDKLKEMTKNPTPEIFAQESVKFIKDIRGYVADILPFVFYQTGVTKENATK